MKKEKTQYERLSRAHKKLVDRKMDEFQDIDPLTNKKFEGTRREEMLQALSSPQSVALLVEEAEAKHAGKIAARRGRGNTSVASR